MPDHRLGELGNVERLAREFGDHPSPAHHRDPIGKGHHLGQLVGDVDRALPLPGQPAEHPFKYLDLRASESRRGFIEDEYIRSGCEGDQDFEPLALADRQFGDRAVEVDFEFEVGGGSLQLAAGRGRAPGEVDQQHRKRRNRDVDWLIDRAVQKSETYSGIDGINNQDHAVQDSMRPIVDRSKENLGTTDAAVIATRRILLRRLKNAPPDEDPPGVAPTYYGVRAIEWVIDRDVDWRTEMRHLFNRPAEEPPVPHA